ncbi:MAG: SDR family NAD(P)-dependent oxidoreductase, partial [Bdellovibrionales bacterium]|nr:SDR family NAD(P)-dependent oxidoreductase [Bdellovibrionales bacterium]
MQMFKDKTVIVTGAARGIGRGIATHLAQQGAQLILVDCDQEGLEESSKIISGATTFCGDVTDQAFVNKVVASCSQVDVLINNAGVTRDNLVAKISENDWDQVMAVNLKGPFLF